MERKNNKMKIAVLGGSFDPPHFGHFQSVQQLLGSHVCDQVWLMPCHAHVWGKKLSPVEHRLAMTKLLANKKIKVSTLEIEQKRAMPTIETLNLLREKYPQHQFFWIVGEKSRPELPRWQDYEKIKEQIIIVPDINSISSSLIRQKIRAGLPINGLVPTKIEEYIRENKFYQ